MRSEMRVQKKQKSSVAMTVWIFTVGINSAMKKAGFKTNVKLKRKKNGYSAEMKCCDGYDIPRFQAGAFSCQKKVISGLKAWAESIAPPETAIQKDMRYAAAIGEAIGYLEMAGEKG